MIGVVGTAALAPALLALNPSTASAVGCYGDYCSGRDPQATGCAAGAYATAAANIPSTGAVVQLIWSPTCKTNWTRTNWPVQPYNTLSAVQQQTNYTQSGVSGTGGGWSWTRMIYSPSLGVSARFGGAPGSASTAFA